MRLSSFLPLGLSAIALAAPTPTIEEKRGVLAKRASVTDVPDTGYATQNGGTTGGKGGSTTTVSTLAQFTAAVKGDDAKIVIVSGGFKGNADNVKIGSNKSIIGKDSSAGALDSSSLTHLMPTLNRYPSAHANLRDFNLQSSKTSLSPSKTPKTSSSATWP